MIVGCMPPMTSPRNLVNLKDATKGYAARTVLADVTLGISAGDRIGDRRPQRRRQVDAAAADRGRRGARRRRGHALRRAARGDARPGRRPRPVDARSARSSSAAAPTTSGRPTRAYRNVLDGLLGGVEIAPLPAGAGHADRAAVAAASGGGSRWPRRCSATPSCCCSTSRPTTSTSRASTGSRATSPRAAASMLVVTHDRWFLDAVCTHTWEVADSDGAPVRGRLRGLRARARRARRARPRRARSAASS